MTTYVLKIYIICLHKKIFRIAKFEFPIKVFDFNIVNLDYSRDAAANASKHFFFLNEKERERIL